MFIDFHRFPAFIDFHRFSWLCMNFFGFLWILRGSVARVPVGLWHPVASCGILWHPVAADRVPYILSFWILEAWIWRPGCLDAGRVAGMWLLDGRRGSKDVPHARRSRRSADFRKMRQIWPNCAQKECLKCDPMRGNPASVGQLSDLTRFQRA